MNPILKKFDFLFFYLRNNIATAMEYRFSFLSQVFGMFINDALWVTFWVLFFQKFPVLNGWTIKDVLIMWAIVTTSYGLCFGLFFNVGRLAELITLGQLDYYLALPKNVLFHLSVSQIRPVNLGDSLFGPILLLFFVHPSWDQWIVFGIACGLAALIYYSFAVLIGSMAFFWGQADSFASSAQMALIHFSTYPTRIFEGWVKIVLYTVIPAGFIVEVPVSLVRNFQWSQLGLLIFAAAMFFSLAIGVFHLGLKRYESGNLLQMRS